MCGGPFGVGRGQATAFFSGILMASTWKPELIFKLSGAITEKVKAKELNVILGP